MNSWEKLSDFEECGDQADRETERDDYEETAEDEEREERIAEILDLLEAFFDSSFGPLFDEVDDWLGGDTDPEPEKLDMLLKATENETVHDLVAELKEYFA
ncbi:MAG: hypothetical protein WC683_07040 [bacterium]